MARSSRPVGRPPKQQRPTPPHPRIATEQNGRFCCCRCTRDYTRQKGYFYASQSPLWRANNGYLPVCRNCVDEIYLNYRQSLGNEHDALHRLCMKFDIYWSEDVYEYALQINGATTLMSAYISRSNLKQYLNKTYDDTLREEAEERRRIESGMDAPDKPEELVVTQVDINIWGPGYTADFYASLNRRYSLWTNDAKDLTPAEQSLYRQICLLEELIARGGAKGEPIDKYISKLNDLLGSMGIKPSQQKLDVADDDIDNTPLGVWAYRLENEEPIPEADPELQDVDGVIKYIDTWVRGHLAKMLGKKNAYSKLYDEAIEKMRIEHPDYADEEDEDLMYDVLGGYDDEDDEDNE